MNKTQKAKLKAYLSASYLTEGDAYIETGYCETCAGTEKAGFTMETLLKLIDDYDEEKVK